MNRRISFILGTSVFLLSILLVSTSDGNTSMQKKHAIGTHGATLGLGYKWVRSKIDPSLGNDQFSSPLPDQFFLVTIEQEGILDSESDYMDLLSQYLAGMKTAALRFNSQVDKPQVKNGMHILHATVKAQVNRIDVVYHVYLTGEESLNYLFLFWAVKGKQGLLELESWNILSSLVMPASGSKWRANLKPSTHTYNKEGYRFDISYPGSIFSEKKEDGEAFLVLASGDSNILIYFFVYDSDRENVQLVQDTLELLKADFPNIRKNEVKDIVINGRQGAQSTFTPIEANEDGFIISIVNLDRRNKLQVRLHSSNRPEAKMKYLSPILDSLKISEPEDLGILAFPTATGPSKENSLNPFQKSLLEVSEFTGSFSGYTEGFVALKNGSIASVGHEEVSLLAPPAKDAKVNFSFDEWSSGRSAAFIGKEMYYTVDNELFIFDGSKNRKAGITAACVFTPDNERLFIIRKNTKFDNVHMQSYTRRIPSALYTRDKNGKEALVFEAEGMMKKMCTDDSGNTALVSIERNWKNIGNDRNIDLVAVDVRSKKKTPLGFWNAISQLSPADGGFLVTGTLGDSARGVYFVNLTDSYELLLAGTDCTGIYLKNKKLCFSTSKTTDKNWRKNGSSYIYTVPLDVAKKYGKNWCYFSGREIQKAGEDTLEALGTDISGGRRYLSEKSIDTYVKAAAEVTQKLFGKAMPKDKFMFDDILNGLISDWNMRKEGKLFLAAHLAWIIGDEKAQWLEPEKPGTGRPSAPDIDVSAGLYGYGINPYLVIESSFSDYEEGWYNPASTLIEQANGRTIYLSDDSGALVKKISAESPDELDAIIKGGDKPAIIRFLSSYPQNLHMRDIVYSELCMRHPPELTQSIAGHFISQGKRTDQKAYYAVIDHDKTFRNNADEHIGVLKKIIEANPNDYLFYYCLGVAYEYSTLKNKVVLARACYERALEFYNPDDVKALINRRLDAGDSTKD